jgi:hypothetical protein
MESHALLDYPFQSFAIAPILRRKSRERLAEFHLFVRELGQFYQSECNDVWCNKSGEWVVDSLAMQTLISITQ